MVGGAFYFVQGVIPEMKESFLLLQEVEGINTDSFAFSQVVKQGSCKSGFFFLQRIIQDDANAAVSPIIIKRVRI